MKPFLSALRASAFATVLLPAFSFSSASVADSEGASHLELPYWKQTENRYEPERTCSLTSLAMVTDYLQLTDPAQHGRTPDYLFEQLDGVRQTVPALQEGFNTIAEHASSELRAYSKTDGTIQELQQALAAGHPAIVHGWFTPSGHIVVVTGFDGEHYTVNDPNGRWNLKKRGGYDTSVSGEKLRYPKDAFELAINDNGTGDDLWLHIFR
ncbi:peptidoglycan-binding protein [Microbulbifer flavimaris]|uniref:Peptidoglycan-binding protein n=1 Tax=Microbulbifer flavimaris TaxID=1781068 RepID=A0ABX4I2H5_9GAMM|nr:MULTISPECIES: C39 family peptidase [Microbulbifer]KUJ84533.1 peptidoglycan-binding protein [Microbulbifer sp. ZGT114]PCO06620.1 peptidoglycan-binding protein [Microbulbifer flavimaris]